MAVKKEVRSITDTETIYSLDIINGTAEAKVSNGVVSVFIQLEDGSRSDMMVEIAHAPLVMELVKAITGK